MPPFGLRHWHSSASVCGHTCHAVRISPSWWSSSSSAASTFFAVSRPRVIPAWLVTTNIKWLCSGRSFSATPGNSSTTMLPFASSGISRASLSLTSVPPRSKNSAALPFGLAIEKIFARRLRLTPVNVVANVREHFVHDFDPGLGLRFGDHERGIYSNLGKVAHDDEAALEAFGEDQLGNFFAEQFLRFEIAHQLDADQQPLAAHVPDEFIFFLELHQPRQHHRADFARVLDQVLPLNRADRFRHRHRRQRISAVARRRRARLAERLRFTQLVAQQHARDRKSGAHAL